MVKLIFPNAMCRQTWYGEVIYTNEEYVAIKNGQIIIIITTIIFLNGVIS